MPMCRFEETRRLHCCIVLEDPCPMAHDRSWIKKESKARKSTPASVRPIQCTNEVATECASEDRYLLRALAKKAGCHLKHSMRAETPSRVKSIDTKGLCFGGVRVGNYLVAVDPLVTSHTTALR